MPYVRDLVKRKVKKSIPTIDPEASVFEALKKLAKSNVGALLVVENEAIEGVFSERDYARKIILDGKQSNRTKVHQVMTKKVLYIRLDNTLEECMIVMSGRGIRHLPVLHDGELVDLISMNDVIESIVDNKDFLINQLTQYITGHQVAQKSSWYTPIPDNVVPIDTNVGLDQASSSNISR